MSLELYIMLLDWLASGTDGQKRHAEHRLSLPDAIGYVPPSPAIHHAPPAARSLARPIDPWTIITAEQLVRDTRALIAELPSDVDLVVAIARSGLMPGSLIASSLHLPIRTVSRRHGLGDPGHGGRMAPDPWDARSILPPMDPRHVLLIDDTAAQGNEMRECAATVAQAWPQARLTRAVIYCHPQAVAHVDLTFAIYPGLHYLSWNWPNSGHGQACGFDFDGILCDEWIQGRSDLDARPLYLPRRKPISLIVSARHETRRPESEAWLNRYGVKVDRLVLRDWEAKEDFQTEVAIWKGEMIKDTAITLFAESDPYQAEVINRVSGKPVLCPTLGRVLPPIATADPNAPRKPCCH